MRYKLICLSANGSSEYIFWLAYVFLWNCERLYGGCSSGLFNERAAEKKMAMQGGQKSECTGLRITEEDKNVTFRIQKKKYIFFPPVIQGLMI